MSKPSSLSRWILSALTALATTASAATSVVVDPATRYQTFKGWGASLCWWANMAGGWSEAKIDTLCGWITSPDELNMNVFRYNIGGGDNPTHHHLRTDGGAVPGFKASASAPYDWSQDANQRKILQRLVAMRTDAILQAFSNSPPWWMTKSGCASGNTDGSDNLLDTDYTAFADYLTEVVRHYHDSLKIDFQSLEPFNEPFSSWWKALGTQEGCAFDQADQNKLVPLLYAQLQSKNMLSYTRIAAMDGNSIDQTLSGANGYSSAGIAGKIGQIQTHTYGGSQRAQLHDWSVANKVELWQSESGVGGSNTVANGLVMAARIITDLRDLKPVVWCDWQIATANDPVWGLVPADYAKQTMTRSLTYYVRMQCSRFIGPGYTMIATDQSNTVAAVDPDSSRLVLVLCNQDSLATPYSIDLTRFKSVGPPVLYRTSSTENCSKVAGPALKSGLLQYSAPAISLSTFVFPLQSTSLGRPTSVAPAFRAIRSGDRVDVTLAHPSGTASYRMLGPDGAVLRSGALRDASTSITLPGSARNLIFLEVVDRGRRLGIQALLAH
jgi:O-glycosyl hydrolase